MKRYNHLLLTIMSLLAILGTSCKKSFFTDANINLNSPSNVSEPFILGPVENGIAYSVGGDMSRFTSLITQQTLGFSRQAAGYYSYVFTEQDFDGLWASLYEDCMLNTDTLIGLADKNGNHEYAGIGRVLLAYTLQMTVDMWGDIPYSEAFQGFANLAPTYDPAQDVYNNILGLCDAGIANLSDPDPGGLLPDADDNIYFGDADKWIKFAHAIKARIYIHQSKNNAAMAQNALDEANQSFTDNSDNAVYVFGIIETNANPIYQFNQQRADIAYDGSTLANSLITVINDSTIVVNDPRYNVFITPDFSDVNGVGLGDYYGSIDAPVEFICYDEIEFIKCEATLRTSGDIAAAAVFYAAAITANFEKLGLDAADATVYIAANPLPTSSVDAALTELGIQEWIALYLNPEAFTSWRRLNSPTLQPVSGTDVPRRFLYVQAERSYNPNTPQATVFAPKLFWDN